MFGNMNHELLIIKDLYPQNNELSFFHGNESVSQVIFTAANFVTVLSPLAQLSPDIQELQCLIQVLLINAKTKLIQYGFL